MSALCVFKRNRFHTSHYAYHFRESLWNEIFGTLHGLSKNLADRGAFAARDNEMIVPEKPMLPKS